MLTPAYYKRGLRYWSYEDDSRKEQGSVLCSMMVGQFRYFDKYIEVTVLHSNTQPLANIADGEVVTHFSIFREQAAGDVKRGQKPVPSVGLTGK